MNAKEFIEKEWIKGKKKTLFLVCCCLDLNWTYSENKVHIINDTINDSNNIIIIIYSFCLSIIYGQITTYNKAAYFSMLSHN